METINPVELDIATLPSVLFDERKALPIMSAVYFALGVEDTILYIGKTMNLRRRWYTHTRRADLAAAGCLRIAWIVCDASIALQIEVALLHYFTPPFNSMKTVPGLRDIGEATVDTLGLQPLENIRPSIQLFSSRLRDARHLRRMSQKALAVHAAIPITSISHFEGGNRLPSLENFARLADALDVAADFLLGRQDHPGVSSAEAAWSTQAQALSAENRALVAAFITLLLQRQGELPAGATGMRPLADTD